MKRTFWAAFIAIYVISLLTCIGVVRYNKVQTDMAVLNLGTDSEIETYLYEHGFNLTWDEQPTAIDYITSNFK